MFCIRVVFLNKYSLIINSLTYFYVGVYSEIDQNSGCITEEIEKSKESALQRKIQLEEKRDSFQKTTYAIFDMLNGRDTS